MPWRGGGSKQTGKRPPWHPKGIPAFPKPRPGCTVSTKVGRQRGTTESTARDRLLRELLEMAMNELSFTPPFSQEKLTGTMCQWDFQDPRIPGILPIAKDYVTNRHHFWSSSHWRRFYPCVCVQDREGNPPATCGEGTCPKSRVSFTGVLKRE